MEKIIKTIISYQLQVPVEEIFDNSDVVTDLGMDSLDRVEMIMAFEEEFDIQIPDGDADTLRKVKDIINYIKSKKG